jgi:hypothetical protein
MEPSPNLIFLIRARTGWTKMLHQLAQKESRPDIPVLVDGPYATCPELHVGFDTVLLFAGECRKSAPLHECDCSPLYCPYMLHF